MTRFNPLGLSAIFFFMITPLFYGCLSENVVMPDVKNFALPAGKSALITFRNGDKCFISDWEFLYEADVRETVGNVVGNLVESWDVIRTYRQKTKRLFIDNTDSGAVSVDYLDLSTIQYFYDPTTLSQEKMAVSQVKIITHDQRTFLLTPSDRLSLVPQTNYEWNMTALQQSEPKNTPPQKIKLIGTVGDCSLKLEGSFTLSNRLFERMQAPIRIQFFLS